MYRTPVYILVWLLFFTLTSYGEPTNAKAVIEEASKAGQYLLLTFFNGKDESFAALTNVTETFKKSVTKKPAIYAAGISDPANKELVLKYGIDNNSLPILLVIAPNGVVTGGLIGYVIGTVIAVLLGPKIAGVPVYPIPLFIVWGLLISTVLALIASAIPAAKAASVDPSLIMKEE